MSIQLFQIVDDIVRSKIGNRAREAMDVWAALLNDKLDLPVDVSVSGAVITIEDGIKQKLESDGVSGTQNAVKWRLPTLGGLDIRPVASTLNLGSGATTGDFKDNPAAGVSIGANQFIQMGIELRQDGKYYPVWGTASAVSGSTTVPAFSKSKAFPILVAKLQNNGTPGTWNFVTPIKSAIEVIMGGTGGGGGAGDTTGLIETMKNMALDMPYELLTPCVFDTDELTFVDVLSSGSFSYSDRAYLLPTIDQQFVSTNLLDPSEFISDGLTVGQIDLAVFWKPGRADKTATYWSSRSGAVSGWQQITMERIGNATDTLVGRLIFDSAYADASDLRIKVITKSGNTVWVEGATYDSKSFGVGGQNVMPQGVFFKPDGTKMYMVGGVAGTIYQYALTTAWDVSTANYSTPVSFSVAGQDITPRDMYFSSDGLTMFVVGSANDKVYQYPLITPWDISTATYTGSFLSVAAIGSTPTGLFITPDGQTLYITEKDSSVVAVYGLPTPWSLAGATYLSSLSVLAQEASPQAITFVPNGRRMFIAGLSGKDITVYDLSTPWDISTATYSAVLSVAAQDAGPVGMYLKPDTTKLYVLGQISKTVYQYTVPVADPAIDAFGVFYRNIDAGMQITGRKNFEVQSFNSKTDKLSPCSFTLTRFIPDPDMMIAICDGSIYQYGDFAIDGQKVTFADRFFETPDSKTLLIKFMHVGAGAFDNSDVNASLLAANHLGSTDANYDRSLVGRGILLRRPDGTLREAVLDNDDNWNILST